jgi:hypothetical protein
MIKLFKEKFQGLILITVIYLIFIKFILINYCFSFFIELSEGCIDLNIFARTIIYITSIHLNNGFLIYLLIDIPFISFSIYLEKNCRYDKMVKEHYRILFYLCILMNLLIIIGIVFFINSF